MKKWFYFVLKCKILLVSANLYAFLVLDFRPNTAEQWLSSLSMLNDWTLGGHNGVHPYNTGFNLDHGFVAQAWCHWKILMLKLLIDVLT